MSASRLDMSGSVAGFDVDSVRADFPALHQQVRGKPLVYLDNAATAHKPQTVIDAVSDFYARDYSNVHRAVHSLAERATLAYEQARDKVRAFVNAEDRKEVVFTRGTTEAINLVAASWGRANLTAGDEILITEMEHHANIVPWQLLCQQTGAKLRVAPIDDDGTLLVDEFERLLSERTRLVALAHVSNTLGTVNPVARLVEMAKRVGARTLVDGAQAAPHMPIDVQALGCDFYAFSGHKMYAPTGIGMLYGKAELLRDMPPYQGGGEMIRTVSFEDSTYADIPYKFEAGTQHIAGAIGLGAAIDYLNRIGLEAVAAYEEQLARYAHEALSGIEGLRIFGTAPGKAAIVSFVLDGVHAHDIGTIMDSEGVAVRVGHHCAMPLMKRYGVPATARAAFAFYNTRQEVDAFVAAIGKAQEVFSRE